MKRSEALILRGIRLTSPERVLYPEQGITKRELASYYEAVAERILPHLAGRPLTMLRCPAGRQKSCFVQRKADASFSPALRRVEVPGEDGAATYLAAESVEALIALTQVGVLELHTWGSRRDRLDRPDRMIFDLDPGPGVEWPEIVGAAVEVRRRLADLGLGAFVKTSGGKGLHVVVPLVRRHGWDEVRAFARALAEWMAEGRPERYVAEAAKAERGGKIFIDYLRNGWSASAVAAYSPRARPGAPVSMPVGWSELEAGARPEAFTVRSVPSLLADRSRDPWEDYAGAARRITRVMRRAIGVV